MYFQSCSSVISSGTVALVDQGTRPMRLRAMPGDPPLLKGEPHGADPRKCSFIYLFVPESIGSAGFRQRRAISTTSGDVCDNRLHMI
jgi:hypothetical protein